MANDDMNLEKAVKKGKGFSAGQIMLAFLFLAGLIIGGAATHYLIEPVLNAQAMQNFSSCSQANQRLNAEIEACLKQNESIANPTGIHRVTLAKYENIGTETELARKNYYALTAYATGSMQLQTEKNNLGPYDKPLARQSFLELAGQINESGFLNEPYRLDNGPPIYAIIVENQSGSSEKTLECGTPLSDNCPAAFIAVKQKIEELWGEPLPTD